MNFVNQFLRSEKDLVLLFLSVILFVMLFTSSLILLFLCVVNDRPPFFSLVLDLVALFVVICFVLILDCRAGIITINEHRIVARSVFGFSHYEWDRCLVESISVIKKKGRAVALLYSLVRS